MLQAPRIAVAAGFSKTRSYSFSPFSLPVDILMMCLVLSKLYDMMEQPQGPHNIVRSRKAGLWMAQQQSTERDIKTIVYQFMLRQITSDRPHN